MNTSFNLIKDTTPVTPVLTERQELDTNSVVIVFYEETNFCRVVCGKIDSVEIQQMGGLSERKES